jgi:hypothetical protein
MKRIAYVAALCCAAFSFKASAQSIENAGDFYSACSVASNLDLCAMYLSGFTSGVQAQVVVGKAPAKYCLPRGTTHKQNLQTVLSFLSANPTERDQPTTVVVYLALSKAHPCQ